MEKSEKTEVEVVPETQFELDTIEESQVIPETQFDEDHEPVLEIGSLQEPGTQVLASTKLISQTSDEQDLAETDFILSRPKSSGLDIGSTFVFSKAERPKLNFSRGKSQPSQASTCSEVLLKSSDHQSGEQPLLRPLSPRANHAHASSHLLSTFRVTTSLPNCDCISTSNTN
jgi:hypothetical protein